MLSIILLNVFQIHAQGTTYFDSTFTGYFRLTSGGWTAGDGSLSVPLPDKRIIWLFGDSYIVNVDTSNNTLPCLFQVRNCMMVQDSVNHSHFKTIIDSNQTGVNRSTFKLRINDSTLFWPGHGYVWRDTVFLFLERYSNINMGLYYGEYIAKLHFPDLQLVGIYPVQLNIQYFFGRAVITDTASQTVYIYGNQLNWIVWEPILARCNINQILGPWAYYTGSGWSSSISESQSISMDPVSPGFSVFNWKNKYYLVTQENGYLTCGLGREIYSYESDVPEGPFINKKLLYTEESKFNGKYLLTYNAQAHPFFTTNDKLLIGYNVNDQVDSSLSNPCPSECINIWTDRLDADSYRPKFIRVPMGAITEATGKVDPTNSPLLYPNPVRSGENVTIEVHEKIEDTQRIRLLGTDGRDFGSIPFHEDRYSGIEITAPDQRGVYLIRIITEDKSARVSMLIVI